MGKTKKNLKPETVEYMKKRRLEGAKFKTIAKELKENENLDSISDWTVRQRLKNIKPEKKEVQEPIKAEVKENAEVEPMEKPQTEVKADRELVIKQTPTQNFKLDIAEDINKTDPIKMKAWAENIEVIGNTFVKVAPVLAQVLYAFQQRNQAKQTPTIKEKPKTLKEQIEGKKGVF